MTELNHKNLKEICDWSFPVPIAYGPGRLGELGRRVAEMGVSNPLIGMTSHSFRYSFYHYFQSSISTLSDLLEGNAATRLQRQKMSRV